MTKWIILLRIVGGSLIVIQLLHLILRRQELFQYLEAYLLQVLADALGGVALGVLCFGAAAALKQLQQQDRKLNYIGNRLTSRSRRVETNPYPPTDYPLPPSLQYPEPRDLAPDAPAPANTAHYADAGERIRHSGGRRVVTRVEQDYIDRRYAYRIPDPTVNAAPRPIRQTPGTAGQYMDEELAVTKKRPLPNPSNPYQRAIEDVPDKELLKLGREAYLRRQQGRGE